MLQMSFRPDLKLIWLKSSLKTTKMSTTKKCIFGKKLPQQSMGYSAAPEYLVAPALNKNCRGLGFWVSIDKWKN